MMIRVDLVLTQHGVALRTFESASLHQTHHDLKLAEFVVRGA